MPPAMVNTEPREMEPELVSPAKAMAELASLMFWIVPSSISSLEMDVPRVLAMVMVPSPFVILMPEPGVRVARSKSELLPLPMRSCPAVTADPSRPVPPLLTSRYCSAKRVLESCQ